MRGAIPPLPHVCLIRHITFTVNTSFCLSPHHSVSHLSSSYIFFLISSFLSFAIFFFCFSSMGYKILPASYVYQVYQYLFLNVEGNSERIPGGILSACCASSACTIQAGGCKPVPTPPSTILSKRVHPVNLFTEDCILFVSLFRFHKALQELPYCVKMSVCFTCLIPYELCAQ